MKISKKYFLKYTILTKEHTIFAGLNTIARHFFRLNNLNAQLSVTKLS
jgi:hypothetical protein